MHMTHHAREFPVLPHPHVDHPHHEGAGFDQMDGESKEDSGQYLDSHGLSHTFQMHFVDSQGIYRDYHGHGIPVVDGKEVHKHRRDDDKSPYGGHEEGGKPIPPQFIDLHGGHHDNRHVSVESLSGCSSSIEGVSEKRPTIMPKTCCIIF